MNKIEYLRSLKEEKQFIKKHLAYTQPKNIRDLLFKRLLKVSIEIERVKNEMYENRNTNSTKVKEK